MGDSARSLRVDARAMAAPSSPHLRHDFLARAPDACRRFAREEDAMASPAEHAAMLRAVSLAAKGLGSTSPNPVVGCVILDASGAIVGEGFHAYAGGPHAEVRALAAAGDRARGGTAVVTLEPCNHTGRTGPCSEALVEAGIARVVYAVADPTPDATGGAATLAAAGIDVEGGP